VKSLGREGGGFKVGFSLELVTRLHAAMQGGGDGPVPGGAVEVKVEGEAVGDSAFESGAELLLLPFAETLFALVRVIHTSPPSPDQFQGCKLARAAPKSWSRREGAHETAF
jgi:hypothetical protein